VLGAVLARLGEGGTVGILGLSYKPDTAVVECSQGVALATRLIAEGHRVIAYDPKALDAAQAAMSAPLIPAVSAEDCVRRASVVVVTTPWPEFRAIPVEAFTRTERMTVIDCWRLLSQEEVGAVADLVHLGRGASNASAALV